MSPLPRWVLAAREARLALSHVPWTFSYDRASSGMDVSCDSKEDAQFIAQAPQTQERLERALEIALHTLTNLEKRLLNEAEFYAYKQLKNIREGIDAIEKLGDSNG